MPRGVTWKGAGVCLIFSHSRQENFSRTVGITFHCRGTISNVSVMSSPSFDSFTEPQRGHDSDDLVAQVREIRLDQARIADHAMADGIGLQAPVGGSWR